MHDHKEHHLLHHSGDSKDHGPNFFPLPSYNKGFGQLDAEDKGWKCITGKGFQTETHTYYSILEDGSSLMVQVIWSFLG